MENEEKRLTIKEVAELCNVPESLLEEMEDIGLPEYKAVLLATYIRVLRSYIEEFIEDYKSGLKK